MNADGPEDRGNGSHTPMAAPMHIGVKVAQRFVLPQEYLLKPCNSVIPSQVLHRTSLNGTVMSVDGLTPERQESTQNRERETLPQPRRRSTCTLCTRLKKGCDGNYPCRRCFNARVPCVYQVRKKTVPKPGWKTRQTVASSSPCAQGLGTTIHNKYLYC
ncbi:unnamed protein product [Choristocarpus tenellus]